MKAIRSRSAAAVAMAAALSMMATPVMARDWGYGRHYRHNDGIDAGDVIAGVLIIGGIAAIASAASKSSRDKRGQDYRYPDNRYPDRDRDYRDESGRYGDYRDNNSQYRGTQSSGMGSAVDTCVNEVERGNDRVDNVDNVDRDGAGWRVEGRMDNGRAFQCAIDDSGRVRSATVDGRAVS